MKIKVCFFFLVLSFASGSFLSAEKIEPGDWFQTSSSAGDAPDIVMSIIQVTPHIIQLDSNNGWVGYAWYNEDEDEYSGFFELLKDTGMRKEGWTNKVFRIMMVHDRKTIILDGVNGDDEHFSATFRMKREL